MDDYDLFRSSDELHPEHYADLPSETLDLLHTWPARLDTIPAELDLRIDAAGRSSPPR